MLRAVIVGVDVTAARQRTHRNADGFSTQLWRNEDVAVFNNALERVNVSRRQLLQSSAAGALIAVSYLADEGKVPTRPGKLAGPGPAAATTFNRRSVSFFSADHTTQHIWDLATAVELSKIGPDVDEILIELRFDPRVLDARELLVVESNGELQAVTTTIASADERTAVASFALKPPLWTQQRLRFSPPFIARSLYPNDSIEGVFVPSVELKLVGARGSTQVIVRTLAAEVTRAVEPWGVEIAAAWGVVSHSPDESGQYRAPVEVLITSAGPNPTPAGLQIEVRVAEFAAGFPSVRSYSDGVGELPAESINSTTTTGEATRSATFAVAEPLEVGARRSISLDWSEAAVQQSGDAPSRALVRIATEGDEGAPRRGPIGIEAIVDMAAAPAQVKRDLARKGG